MDQLSAMQTFRRVVDLGSFSAAAVQAGVSHTILSRQVKSLERQLGTQLLTRTTRRLHLTEAGGLFYRHCVQILEQMQAMTLELSEHQQQPTGTLRLSVSTAFGELELGRWLPDFVERHEGLQIELNCTDRAGSRASLPPAPWHTQHTRRTRRPPTARLQPTAAPTTAVARWCQ